MTSAITRLSIEPSYDRGFQYVWSMDGGFHDPGPWMFTVQESVTVPDDWKDLSPKLDTVYRWSDGIRRLVNKNMVAYYRVKLETVNGVYYSPVVAPWGELDRREYLLISDIMRREVLHARTLAGILGDLWIKSVYGPRCPLCVDPITGNIRNSRCPKCLGTGYYPPYHGPYQVWVSFSTTGGTTDFSQDGSGTVQPRQFEVRMIGTPPVTKGDALIDPRSDKRYIVQGNQVLAEVRRIPVVQTMTVMEAPTTDAVYKIVV